MRQRTNLQKIVISPIFFKSRRRSGGFRKKTLVTGDGSLIHYVDRYIINKLDTKKLLCPDKEKQLSKTGPYHIMLRRNKRKAYSQKKKIMGNSCKS